MRLRSAAAGLLSAALLTACGTTVPISGRQQSASVDSGLGTPGAVTPQPEGTAAPGVTGGQPQVGTGTPGSASGPTAPPAGGTEVSTPPVPGPAARITSPIVVGVLGIKRVAELASAAGVSTGQTFAPTEAFKAAAKRFGGSLQGRPLKVVVAEIDPSSSSYSSDFEAACQRLTQDEKASVVLSLDVIGAEPFTACLHHAGVTQINTGYGGFDRDAYRRYPNVVNLGAPDIDGRVQAVVDGSRAAGRLRSGDRVGVIVEQCAGNQRAYDRTLAPALKSAGATVTRYDVSCINGAGSLGAAGSSQSGAVLQFQAARVTKVLFVSNFEGALLLLFASQSESQGFRPTYLLSSTAAVTTALSNLSAGQRPGLTGIGWMPTMDTSAGAAPTTSAQRTCVATMRAAGLSTSGNLDALAAYSACDAFAFLDRLLARTRGATSEVALRQALAAASGGAAVTSVLTEGVRLAPDRPTGPQTARPWQWVKDCDCLRYSGAQRPL